MGLRKTMHEWESQWRTSTMLNWRGIVDIEGVSQSNQLKALQHISLWKDDKMMNVLAGNIILNKETLPSYFTSAFPTIFPWGTGKHLDNRRMGESRLDLKRWMQLLLKTLQGMNPRGLS